MMSNSPLVSYVNISPNSTNPRNNIIKKITIHHMAGNMTLEALGVYISTPARQMSCNYGIDSNGKIGMYCEEKNRSWCSSSPANDHQAITIEVANNGGEPNWPVSDKALRALIDLCEDICRRNKIEKLNFTGDATGNLTQHNYFSATACPGPYLKSKFQYIADEVNKRLTGVDPEENDMTVLLKLDNTIRNNQIFSTPNNYGDIIAEKKDVPIGLYIVTDTDVSGTVVGDTKWAEILWLDGSKGYVTYGGIVEAGAKLLRPMEIYEQYGSPMALYDSDRVDHEGCVTQEEYDRVLDQLAAIKHEHSATLGVLETARISVEFLKNL